MKDTSLTQKVHFTFPGYLCCLTILLSFILNVFASEYHVSPQGNDRNDGSKNMPLVKIQKAISLAQSGDKIILADGVYRESLNIEKSKISIMASGKAAIIDGEENAENGLVITSVENVIISGLEIKNFTECGIKISWATNCIIEKNIIHDIGSKTGISSAGKWVTGIYAFYRCQNMQIRQNAIYFICGHNESYGMYLAHSSTLVEQNLVYLVDKTGIRVVDTDTIGKKHALDKTVVRGNILINNGYCGIDVNMMQSDFGVIVEHNFCGWNGANGINPKHSFNWQLLHNTMYANCYSGILVNSPEPRSTNGRAFENIIADNASGFRIHLMGENCNFDSNFYTKKNPSSTVFHDTTWTGAGKAYLMLSDVKTKTPYEARGMEANNDNTFIDTAKGDFRINNISAAKNAASGKTDMGAWAAILKEVGPDAIYGLDNIPLIHCYALQLAEISGEREKFPGKNLIDGSTDPSAVWQCDGSDAMVIFTLPGEGQAAIGSIQIARAGHNKQYNPKEIDISIRQNTKSAWKEVLNGECYQGGAGRIFVFPNGTQAKQIKIEINNHGADYTEIADIRIYAPFKIR
ncbi:MAG TPA: hypothetical protein DC049_05515 [Spirochaetia bacterium]|nr:hypothetical protein [Spirochaetia bacterium]